MPPGVRGPSHATPRCGDRSHHPLDAGTGHVRNRAISLPLAAVMLDRRTFLVSAAIWFAGTTSLTRASVIRDHMPWAPFPSSAPHIERPGPWKFFTVDEANAIEAIVPRIIPPDPQTPGGKETGCAVFIDRQLSGPYGSSAGLYRMGPF